MDDWRDPASGTVHGIDGVDLWPSLSAGDVAAPPLPRTWLPTTERSIIWDNRTYTYRLGVDGGGDGAAAVAVAGHMYKLVVNESQANRFTANGTQYMDDKNPCLPTAGTDSEHGNDEARIHARQAAAAKPFVLYLPFNHVHNPQFCSQAWCNSSTAVSPAGTPRTPDVRAIAEGPTLRAAHEPRRV